MSRLDAALIRAAQGTDVRSELVPMMGGFDQITAPLARKPGTLKAAQNFEAVQLGGYRRIKGYEAFDGQASPSDAQYATLDATITGSAALGNTLTGATSGATGVIIALPGGMFVLTKVSGTYQAGENLNVGGPTIATANAAQVGLNASTPKLHAQYLNLAADQYRADIGAVPGSGAILGVWQYNDVVYAFRNNAGGTAADMYKSTASGWAQVNFEYEVPFTAGSGDIDDGDTLTQGAVTATIRRVVITTGSLSGTNAAGILVISAPSGGNFAAGAATTNTSGALTLSGAQTAITLQPSGRFEFITENFTGSTDTKRMYGCDGKNRAFEFDGSYFVPIPTGMTTDTPEHIWAHKQQLFLSFKASVQHSGPGTPFAFSIVLGAAELAVGDTVSGFMTLPGSEAGGALAIYTRNRLFVLYGSGTADWNLVSYRKELGAYPYTIQDIGLTLALDDRGVMDLQASQVFGNFAHVSITDEVRDYINLYRPLAVASCISRDRNQYRLFFSNKQALYITVANRKVVGVMPIVFADAVRCICSLEKNDGSEAIYFGSDDGWVYQLDKGTSFNGADIEFILELSYLFQKSPRVNKKYRDAMLEINGSGYAEFNFGFTLGYRSTEIPQPDTQAVVTNFFPTAWDSFTWDAFFWDGVTLAPSILKMEGEAENVSLVLSGISDYFADFTVTGVVIQYTPRRRLR